MTSTDLDLGKYKLGWSDAEDYVFKPKKGLNESIVREMSAMKKEPDWMRDFRLRALQRFEKRPMAEWFAVNMPDLDFDDIYYYIKPTSGQVEDWNDLPDAIKNTYEKLGIPEAERKYLAGVTAQYESEVVFHRNREDLEALGIIFCDMDTAVREHPDLVRKYFGTIIPPERQQVRRAQLGGVVRRVVHLRAARRRGRPAAAGLLPDQRREHGPVRADADHRRRGCPGALHRRLLGPGVHDRLPALRRRRAGRPRGSRITYTTIQNWSNNVYNLVTKRARAEAEAHVEWIDGNIGSRLTMKYPSVYLMGPKASGEVLSVAYAGAGQHQDAGAKMVHAAPETTSTIVSKSISKDAGITTYRGLVHVDEGAKNAKSFVRCDALLLDDTSVSETKPYMEVGERDARIGHEATVSKVGDDQLFYLMSRGLSETQAMGMIVNGFIEPITRTLPMEYAVEWSRLIELQMEGSIG